MNGKQLVSKVAFAEGDESASFFDEILSQCQISGWMNETIGSYTCTTDCQAPVNNDNVFDITWTDATGITIDTTFEYASP